ncbi:hypothetical protein AXW84_11180 [Hymenobacter sp. PAMC 26628]|nr:hypothetical protein AXW84_11180 [Hymenobacter sp. PAMC 26628]
MVNDELLVIARGSALEIQTAAGAVCGTIISDVVSVIDCINQGFSYVAVVKSISAGKCTVDIRHQ